MKKQVRRVSTWFVMVSFLVVSMSFVAPALVTKAFAEWGMEGGLDSGGNSQDDLDAAVVSGDEDTAFKACGYGDNNICGGKCSDKKKTCKVLNGECECNP